MRALVAVVCGLLSLGAAHGAQDWTLGAQTGLNNDSNLEAQVDFEVGRFSFAAWARQAVFDEVVSAGSWCKCGPRLALSEGEELEYTLSAHVVVGTAWSTSVHGPIANYTKRADGHKSWMLGYRVELHGGR